MTQICAWCRVAEVMLGRLGIHVGAERWPVGDLDDEVRELLGDELEAAGDELTLTHPLFEQALESAPGNTAIERANDAVQRWAVLERRAGLQRSCHQIGCTVDGDHIDACLREIFELFMTAIAELDASSV